MRGLRSRIFYGWVVVAVAALVILLGAGTRAAPGALLLGNGVGDYALAFIAAGWMAIAAGVVALLIRRPTAPRLVPIPAD